MRTGSTLPIALAFAVARLVSAGSASAEPEFPGKLQDQQGTVCIVTCLTCHTDPAGGADHLKQPFGIQLGGAVLTGSADAFTAINMNDSDGDGVHDLDEVKAGHDPLVPGATSICTPSYGCGARVAHAPPSDDRATAPALLLAVAALGWVGRRRSAQHVR